MPETFEHEDVLSSPQNKLRKERKPRKEGGLKPCERCKAQHLKCVYASDKSSCQRCERSSHECVRSTKRIRFRDVPVSKFRNGSKSIPATTTNNNSESAVLKFVDETMSAGGSQTDYKKTTIVPHVAAFTYSTPNQNGSSSMHDTQLELNANEAGESKNSSVGTIIQVELQQLTQVESQSSNATNLRNNELEQKQDTSSFSGIWSPHDGHFSISSEQDHPGGERLFSSDRLSTISFGSSPRRWLNRTVPTVFLDQMVKAPSAKVASDSQSYIETVLLNYFREQLAPWFDLCDPDRHFAHVVPQRARNPGPLRSALLTISARSLSRNQTFRSETGVVQWKGRLLPELKEEFAMPYHNECIRDLLQLSMDPKNLRDETLLAAVIALRTDEELGVNIQDEEEDQQLFLRIASLFVDAQLPLYLALPHSSPRVFYPAPVEETSPAPSNQAESEFGASGLQQACFWTAFRQDLHAAFLKQQPVRFPLSRCEAFRQLTPATDAVWANRMVTFCADVLEFCYGSESVDAKVAPAYTDPGRWRDLRAHEASLSALLPSTFEPTYCCEPDPAKGEVFPSLFYLETTHVSGTTYVELARMLLEVFNPTRPKLGHGFLAATNAFISSTKKILFRLCGIALSNHDWASPPSLINACLGISMFGEYFENSTEQDALLGVLSLMSNRYAYPTGQIANALRRAWYNNEESSSTSFGNMDLG